MAVHVFEIWGKGQEVFFNQIVLILVTLYHIWRARNKVIFESEIQSNMNLLNTIKVHWNEILIFTNTQMKYEKGKNIRGNGSMKNFGEMRNCCVNAFLFWRIKKRKNWVFYVAVVLNGGPKSQNLSF